MERYESNEEHINRPASEIYPLLSDFTHFTPIIADKVENWQATADECSFSAKGFKMGLRISERRPNELVAIETTEISPIKFVAYIELSEVNDRETTLKLALNVELNMMIRMMIGSKLKDGVRQLAHQIAERLSK